MSDLGGRVALVTGGGRGLGAATALALAEAGADVAVMARDSCEVVTVAEMVRAKGRKALGIAADVSEWSSVSEAFEQVREELGPVTIVVNNAAVTSPFTRAIEADPEQWAYALAVNLNGSFFASHAALPDMIDAGWGRIIHISSGSAVNASPAMSAYSASKAGMDHLSRVLASELTATGVASIVLYPGIMETQMQVEARSHAGPEAEMFRQFHEKNLMRAPEEAAAIIAWLCGPEGDGYRGQVVHANSTAVRSLVGLPVLPEEVRRP